jgi:hypothetical protein
MDLDNLKRLLKVKDTYERGIIFKNEKITVINIKIIFLNNTNSMWKA